MKQTIDIASWPRREYFEHYNALDNPYFGVTADVDVTTLYSRAKERGEWFYIRYLHAILRAANSIEEFRYRIDGDRIVLFDRIHVSPTIPRDDGSFGFGRFAYDPCYETFAAGARAETDRVRAGSGLMKGRGGPHIDTIHSTALPWVRFTALSHPSTRGPRAGIMSLATGQTHEREGRRLMPLQFDVHHGFADGRHAGMLLERIQDYFDE